MADETLLAAERAMMRGDAAGAEKMLRDAIAAKPKSVEHHVMLGDILANQKKASAAAAAYAEALRLDMAQPSLLQKYALACFRCGNYAEAEKSARSWLKSAPSAQGWDILACALREQNKAPDALQAIDQGIKLAPADAALLHTRGSVLLKLGRTQEALDVFDRLTAQGVQAPALWRNRGAALAALNRRDDAIAAYTDGTRRWPNDPDLKQALAAARR